MEVGRISQGGQRVINLDNVNQNSDVAGAGVGASVTPQTEEIKTTTGDSSVNQGTSNNKGNINEKEIKKALDKLSGFLTDENTKVEYQYHDKFTNDLMIKIVDKSTNEVLLEIPPKQILDLVAKMMEMVGVLFDKKA